MSVSLLGAADEEKKKGPAPPPAEFPDGIKCLKYIGVNGAPDQEISVEMLDYNWLNECADANKVRGVIELLKSGKEGLYPDLERHAERKLLELVPAKERKKIVLMNLEPTRGEEHQALEDLRSFAADIKGTDATLKSAAPRGGAEGERYMPPVRGQAAAPGASTIKPRARPKLPPKVEELPADGTPKTAADSAARHTTANQDYFRQWERYDADAEVDRLDAEEQALRDSAAAKQRRREEEAAKELARLMDGVDYESMPPHERAYLAAHEKRKGNECFKAGEVKEAVLFYSRSIALDPSSHVVFANRALAHLRENNFEQAERDCTTALDIDPTYIKALSRRGMTRHRRGKYKGAMQDFEAALAFDPANKELNDMLVKAKKKFEESAGATVKASFKRVAIAEDSEDDDDGDDDDDDDESDDDDDDGDDDEMVVVKNSVGAEPAERAAAAPSRFVQHGVLSYDPAEPFSAAPTWSGARPGFAFKKGARGLGYYRDALCGEPIVPPAATPAATCPAPAAPETRRKIAIAEDSDDDDDGGGGEQASAPASAAPRVDTATANATATNKLISPAGSTSSSSSGGSPSQRIMIVEESTSDEDEDEDGGVFSPKSGRVTIVKSPKKSKRAAAAANAAAAATGPSSEEVAAAALAQATAVKGQGATAYGAGDFGAAFAHFVHAAKMLESAAGEAAQQAWLACRNNGAMCLLQLGKHEACVDACDDVLGRDPRNLKALLRKGAALEKMGELAGATDAFRKVTTLDASNGAAQEGLARCVAAGGTGSGAAKAAAEAAKQAGNACFKAGDLEGAVKKYGEGLEAAGAGAEDAVTTALLLNRAAALLKQQRWAAAVGDCDTVLALAPGTVKAQFRRAQARLGLGNTAGALEDFDAVLLLEPANAQATAQRATAAAAYAEQQRRVDAAGKAAKVALAEAEREAEAEAAGAAAKAAATFASPSNRIAIVESDDDEEVDTQKEDPPRSAAVPPAPPPAAKVTKKSTTAPSASTPAKGAKGAVASFLSPDGGGSMSPFTKGYYPSPGEQEATFKSAVARAKAPVSSKAPSTPKTGYEFERVWRTLRADTAAFASYMKLVKPSALHKKLFKAGVEPDVVNSIIDTLKTHTMRDDPGWTFDVLAAMTKVGRFNSVAMMMEKKEKESLAAIFDFLGGVGSAKYSAEKLEAARKAWQV